MTHCATGLRQRAARGQQGKLAWVLLPDAEKNVQRRQPAGRCQRQNDHHSGDAADLHALMRDPRYWRDRNPDLIAKVTEGFQRLYPNG